jgi:dTDP-4-dehydrorhamnose reductase
MKPMEIWGGVECTINRVGNRYFDQVKRSGHWQRADEDLARFAQLGLRTLRFPILWETIAPQSPNEMDWSWTDARLRRLQELGIRPIAGLLHHGSGPRYTSLIDPEFPAKFAHFAAAVAGRYPWIDVYTPINEPLTTARFSGRYGHWYPHGRDDGTFVRALVNQCRAIALAMTEIRKVNSDAILLQTDDLGRTFSTTDLQHQARFDNERRWLGWDLTRGDVQPGHVMWNYLIESGADAADLQSLGEKPCPPNIVGLNYYVTSDRFLDDNTEDYPPEIHGGNGWQIYADDAAVRACHQFSGFGGVIREAHARYHAPIALTEVHLGCTPDEQLRWFMEAWNASSEARARGINLKAVTAWALLGSFDWNTLVTGSQGHYEAGVFDLSDGPPKPTLLADALARLALGCPIPDRSLDSPGWWRRPDRFRRASSLDRDERIRPEGSKFPERRYALASNTGGDE